MEIILLHPREDFVVETFEEFEMRYFGLAKKYIQKLK